MTTLEDVQNAEKALASWDEKLTKHDQAHGTHEAIKQEIEELTEQLADLEEHLRAKKKILYKVADAKELLDLRRRDYAIDQQTALVAG